MINPLKRITIAFVVVALLPLGFIFYELNAVTENEKLIRQIYRNQLDAILFSINQYSDDVIGSWANALNIAMMDEKTRYDSAKGVVSLMNQFGAIRYTYFTDLEGNSITYSTNGADKNLANVKESLDSLVSGNRDRIDRLISYEQTGFKKMELMDTANTDRPVPVFFVLNKNTPQYRVGAMVIDLPELIENTLGPKMQAVAQQEFVIAAFHNDTDSLIYSTAVLDETTALIADDESQKKSFWLLPGYYVSIALMGATINDLVKDRMTTSIIILGLLIFVLALGIWFLYRNIKREMYLAQAKSQFVSNVSHEIRTPLSLISMYAETLEMNRVTEDKKKEYQTVIAKETARLSGIVNRILNFSQIQANKKKYEARAIHLNELIDEVLSTYFFHLKDKGFTCQFIKDESLKIISGDRESIIEAFINLIDNAMKYSPEKKNITIRTGSDGKFTFIEVQDEGIGIAKKHQQEIFDQFYRAPTGDVHNTKGSGLGLTLVKKTVEAHGGKIKLESTPGKGSTFSLYFPTKKEILS